MQRLVFTLGLVLTAAAATACGKSSSPSSPATTHDETKVTGRTLASIEPLITKDLTPALARTRIGAPDEEPGSGLIIFVYALDQGRTLWLSFPGFEPIISARLHNADGTVRDLTPR